MWPPPPPHPVNTCEQFMGSGEGEERGVGLFIKTNLQNYLCCSRRFLPCHDFFLCNSWFRSRLWDRFLFFICHWWRLWHFILFLRLNNWLFFWLFLRLFFLFWLWFWGWSAWPLNARAPRCFVVFSRAFVWTPGTTPLATWYLKFVPIIKHLLVKEQCNTTKKQKKNTKTRKSWF